MSKVTCPYCESRNEIDYSEGDGTQEGKIYSQHCKECEKEFDYDTTISYYHSVFCKDGDHQYRVTENEKLISNQCKRCDQNYTEYK